jgi:hypothetical protein
MLGIEGGNRNELNGRYVEFLPSVRSTLRTEMDTVETGTETVEALDIVLGQIRRIR